MALPTIAGSLQVGTAPELLAQPPTNEQINIPNNSSAFISRRYLF